MSKKPFVPNLPHFLLIGAPEAGCDAIKAILSRNKKVWFPPLDNILAFHPGFQLERLDIAQQMFRKEIPFRPLLLRWYVNYFFQPIPTLKWYSRMLHTKDKELIKGELSDEYMTLPLDGVEKLSRIMPDCKIVMMLRNPVDRSFSAVRTRFSNNQRTPFSKMTKRQILALMNSDWARTHSNYQGVLDSWTVFFPPQNIFFGFYEDLVMQPQAFMGKLCDFIGIPGDQAPDLADFLPKEQKSIPEEIIPHLHPFYRQEITGLAQRLGGHAKHWLKNLPAKTRRAKKVAPPPAATTG